MPLVPVVIVMKPCLLVEVLPGEPEVVLHGGGRGDRRLAERQVAGLPDGIAVFIHHCQRSSQAVVEVIVDLVRARVGPGDPVVVYVQILPGDKPVGAGLGGQVAVEIIYKKGCLAAGVLFCPLPKAVVDVSGQYDRAGFYCRQPVVLVVVQGFFIDPGGVPVGVVGKGRRIVSVDLLQPVGAGAVHVGLGPAVGGAGGPVSYVVVRVGQCPEFTRCMLQTASHIIFVGPIIAGKIRGGDFQKIAIAVE